MLELYIVCIIALFAGVIPGLSLIFLGNFWFERVLGVMQLLVTGFIIFGGLS